MGMSTAGTGTNERRRRPAHDAIAAISRTFVNVEIMRLDVRSPRREGRPMLELAGEIILAVLSFLLLWWNLLQLWSWIWLGVLADPS
jgi:hypothetical protein